MTWHYRNRELDDWGIVRSDEGYIVCQVRGPESESVLSMHREKGTDPWGTRAILVAAAPEMYVALELAEHVISGATDNTERQRAFEAIQNALSKARGLAN